jgi:1-acyl-sn-glycerol-3-phosphate acyltransferase
MAPGEEWRTLPVARPPTSPAFPSIAALGPEGRDHRARQRFPRLYRVARAVCAPALRTLFHLDVRGTEHLPGRGPYILAANHHNYLDGVVLGVAVPRPIAFLVMPRVYQATPLHPAFHRQIGSIPLNLSRPDPGAIKRALRELEDGGVVGIFPEGPFSRDGHLVRGQPGVAVIALRSRAPVVPAAIRGTYEALRGRRFYLPRRHPLSVRFGPPILPGPAHPEPGTRAHREDVTCRIMSAIETLLAADDPVGGRRTGRA